MFCFDAAIHEAVMTLPPDERRDRAKVNDAVRDAPEERRDRWIRVRPDALNAHGAAGPDHAGLMSPTRL